MMPGHVRIRDQRHLFPKPVSTAGIREQTNPAIPNVDGICPLGEMDRDGFFCHGAKPVRQISEDDEQFHPQSTQVCFGLREQ
jgi:hypothetical protein